MSVLKKKSQLSLQDIIVSDIQKKIEKKILKIGQMIPSEDEIRKKYMMVLHFEPCNCIQTTECLNKKLVHLLFSTFRDFRVLAF